MPINRKAIGLVAGSAALMSLAVATVSQFEGRELRAYQDIVGVWTICYGETRGVKPGDVQVGQAVQVEFHSFDTASGPVTLPQFRPVG